MFRADDKRNIPKHLPTADFINVRANKNGLQWCIFDRDTLTGGYVILNEGTLPIDKVMSFELFVEGKG